MYILADLFLSTIVYVSFGIACAFLTYTIIGFWEQLTSDRVLHWEFLKLLWAMLTVLLFVGAAIILSIAYIVAKTLECYFLVEALVHLVWTFACLYAGNLLALSSLVVTRDFIDYIKDLLPQEVEEKEE